MAAEISARAGSDRHLVALDGFDGSGKSTLAATLARILPAVHVIGDSFLGPPRDDQDYLAQIRWGDLASAVAEGLSRQTLVLFDAVFALDVLDRLACRPQTVVYAKKISAAGLWHCGIDLEDYEAGERTGAPFALKLFEYHTRRRPHESADIIFERPENPSAEQPGR